MSFFSKVWAWLKSFGSDVIVFLEPFGKVLMASGGALLTEIALDAVTTMSATSMTNAEKREAAFKQIKKNAEAKGLAAGENVMRAVLELAVAKLKDK